MPPPSSRPPITVLVVDDHQMVVESLVRLLADEEDMRVVATAGTAAEAVAAARRDKPEVVIMDYQLPDADGLVATERIRSELPDTRVLLLTGDVTDSVLLGAIDAECAGYVEKTKAFDELTAAVRAVHAGRAVMPAERLLPRLRQRSSVRVADLTPRESQVLSLLAEGRSNKEIGTELNLALNTVRNHVQNLLTKLGAHSKLEAVAIGRARGLVRSSPGV